MYPILQLTTKTLGKSQIGDLTQKKEEKKRKENITYIRPLRELVLSFHCKLVLVVQSLSHVRLFVTPWTAAHQASLSFTISQSLLNLMSIEWVMSSSHLVLCHPLLLLPSVFPSMWVFSNELALCIRWPKYWNFCISPFNEYSGLTSFRIDWFDLAVQGTLKRVFSNTVVQKHQLFGAKLSL